MDRKGIERELEALTRPDLIQLASELKVTGRHRMKKDQLMQVILVARVYRSLPDSLDILHRLSREDLLRMCEWIGVEARKGARKGYLVDRIKAQKAQGKPEGHPSLKDLRLPGKGRREGRRSPATVATCRPPMVNGSLPEGYGETRIVLIPVDPYLVHVYWELSGSDKRWVKRLVEDEPSPLKAVLRFHDVTEPPVGGFHAAGSFDVEIKIESGNWYVRLLSPERSYMVDLGLRGRGGRFHRIALSNRAGTPRAWPCEEAGEHLKRVLEWRGGVHVDHLAERQRVGDATPMSQVVAKGSQVRPVTEGHRAVVGLPGVGVGTAVPDRIPETKPAHRPVEAVEEPLFRTEEESGTGKPARAPSHRGRGEESRPSHSAGFEDASDGPRTKLGESHERKKSVPRGEGGARSATPPGGNPRSTEIDLSLWCEDQFVSGLSSKQPARAGKEDGKD